MKTVAALALFTASASAFMAPQKAFRPETALAAARSTLSNPSAACPFMECPSKLDGTMVGDVGFDPMLISDTLPDLQWARTAELKHGRIAQLATVGFLWQETFGAQVIRSVPGYADFDCRDPIGAIGKVPLAASVQVFLAIGIVELATFSNTYGDGEPGNLGWGLDFLKKQCPTPEKVEEMKLKEITHCRLGMLAFAGMVAQTYLVDYSTLLGHIPLAK
jgi:hypothetical protein